MDKIIVKIPVRYTALKLLKGDPITNYRVEVQRVLESPAERNAILYNRLLLMKNAPPYLEEIYKRLTAADLIDYIRVIGDPEYTEPGDSTSPVITFLYNCEFDAGKLFRLKEIDPNLAIACTTTLTAEEAKEAEKNVPGVLAIDCRWWLRTKGKYEAFEAVVEPDGTINERGEYVSEAISMFIRPGLKIHGLDESGFGIGDRFMINPPDGSKGYAFTVISKDTALCDRTYERSPYSNQGNLKEAPDYKMSHVLKRLDVFLADLIGYKGRRN